MIGIQSHPWTSWSAWSRAWAELHAASPHASFFLAPEWVEAWLEVFGPTIQPRILVFTEGGAGGKDVVGLCLLVFQIDRVGPFLVRRAHLNTSGEPEPDEVCVEDNTLFCRSGFEDAVASAFAAHLEREEWDELYLSGMSTSPALQAIERSPLGRLSAARKDEPSYFVDLRALDRGPDGYVRTLSRSTRAQVRRTRRALEQKGPLEVRPARTEVQARSVLDELSRLHTLSWNARGKPGAFGSPLFRDFHERLLGKAFPSGRIQLLQVTAGGETVAALYNFAYANTSFFYQSGLRVQPDRRLKVGLVAHACAIEHCREAGLLRYDFLAGDDQYKKSLGRGSRVLSWIVYRRRSPKIRALSLLRKAKRVLGGRSL